jgi:regulator of sigma E protease
MLVTFHELGHFVVARWSRVKIVRFCVGFGRPVWSRYDKRGVEYALAAIPLGGYVRMYDERDAEGAVDQVDLAPGEVSYNQLTPWWRIAIALGGPAANILFAFLVYWMMFLGGTTEPVPMVAEAPENSPAAIAGMEAGQYIAAVDGSETLSWQQIAMGLAGRLGDTGHIRINVGWLGEISTTTLALPIDAWHRGAADPDLFGSLGIKPGWPAVIGYVEPDGPADRAGIEPWDRIVGVDGDAVESWSDWVKVIQAAAGRQLEVTLVRAHSEHLVRVLPDAVEATDGSTVGYLGVGWPSNEIEYGILGAMRQGFLKTGDTTMLTLGLLKKMLTGDVSVANLSSPIMIAKVAGDSARSGWWTFAGVLGLLSISLGILNLLPIPILDGGHIVYCIGELAMGRPVSERVQILGTQVGLFLVVGFLMIAIYNDLLRLF